MQASPPSVLVKDVVGAGGADGRPSFLEEWYTCLPAPMLIVATDRKFNQRRCQVVANLAPIKSRVTHENNEPGKGQQQKTYCNDPVGEFDPAFMANVFHLKEGGGFSF